MKLLARRSSIPSRQSSSRRSAFTLPELLVASTISLMILGGMIAFMDFGGRSLSSATTQTFFNQQAGDAMGFILSRVRFATSISNDASGNTLTLGFDDDLSVDSDKDGKAYNDHDHFEQFQFRNGDGDDGTTADNLLIYIPRLGGTPVQTLLRSGVRKLPNTAVFTITNKSTVLINIGLADNYLKDWNQSVELQLIAVSRNRPATTNVVSILP